MNAILVTEKDGTYEINNAATEEQWEDIVMEAEKVEQIEKLKGWGKYTAAYRVKLRDSDLTYFVEEVVTLSPQSQQHGDAEMNTQTIPEYDAAELYLAIVTHQRGEQIAIHRDGTISYHDSGTRVAWEAGREPVAILRAEGDFDRSEWGIYRDNEAGRWRVATLSGTWDDSDDALKAAVKEFGIQADIIEHMNEKILTEIETTAAEAAQFGK